MGDRSLIEWTDATWNPITGCSIVSPGCTNCYAMQLAGTRLAHLPSRKGLTTASKSKPVWNGRVRFNEEYLTLPMRWRRPRKIFVCAHGDLFAENVPDEWIDRVFAVMALAPWHTYQVLTKRADRMRAWATETWQPAPAMRLSLGFSGRGGHVVDVPAETAPTTRWHRINKALDTIDVPNGSAFWTPEGSLKARAFDFPMPHVWLGVSAEDQRRFDERVADLYNTPAAVRYFSFEPLLGLIDAAGPFSTGAFHWAIVGGESGPDARPMHPDWARRIRDACAETGVAFHFKQHGAWVSVLDREKDDPDWRADYRNAFSDDRPDIAWLNLDGGRGFHGARFQVMRRVGKRAAGRLLDGRTHDAFPEARP